MFASPKASKVSSLEEKLFRDGVRVLYLRNYIYQYTFKIVTLINNDPFLLSFDHIWGGGGKSETPSTKVNEKMVGNWSGSKIVQRITLTFRPL